MAAQFHFSLSVILTGSLTHTHKRCSSWSRCHSSGPEMIFSLRFLGHGGAADVWPGLKLQLNANLNISVHMLRTSFNFYFLWLEKGRWGQCIYLCTGILFGSAPEIKYITYLPPVDVNGTTSLEKYVIWHTLTCLDKEQGGIVNNWAFILGLHAALHITNMWWLKE